MASPYTPYCISGVLPLYHQHISHFFIMYFVFWVGIYWHTEISLPVSMAYSLYLFWLSALAIPAEFYGSSCADCCVNPQITFLSVQDGLVLIQLHFRDERGKKTFETAPPSWPLPQCHFSSSSSSFLMFLFIFETQRNRTWAGEGQRERETQNLNQAPGSELSAQSPTWG